MPRRDGQTPKPTRRQRKRRGRNRQSHMDTGREYLTGRHKRRWERKEIRE